MESLEDKVVRLYLNKGFNIPLFSKLGICSRERAREILDKRGVIRKNTEYRPFQVVDDKDRSPNSK